MDHFAPELWERAGSQGTNDGDGLSADDSHALAAVLTAADETGDLRRWVEEWEANRAALPDLECYICLGDGIRTPEDDLRILGHPLAGHDSPTPCNGCGGTGRRPMPGASYPADYDDLIRWRDFLASITNRFATY